MYCIKCGKELPEGSAYCLYCGSAVGSGNTMGETTNKEVPPVIHQKEKLWTADFWVALLTGLSVSGCIFLIWYEDIYRRISFQNMNVAKGSMALLVGVLMFSAINAGWDLKKGRIRINSRSFLMREVVGTSLGCLMANVNMLFTIGPTNDIEKAIKHLSVEAVISIGVCIAVMIFQRKNGVNTKNNLLSISFCLICIYNTIFYVGGYYWGNNEIYGMLIIFTPGIVAIITGICFYRCRGGEV